MKFSRHKLQEVAEAFSVSGRLAPVAYPNSHGSLGDKFFVASGFTAKFHPRNVFDRSNFNSNS